MGAMLPFPSKRPREEESEDERPDKERKKPRPLPLRTTSFLSNHGNGCCQNDHLTAFHANPPTITPADSSDDDDGTEEHHHEPAARPTVTTKECFYSMRVQPASDADSDLEMTDYPPKSSGPLSPWSAGLHSDIAMPSPIPSQLVNQNLNVSGGRIATPIYSHFTTNMNVDAMMRDTTSSAHLSPWQSNNGPLHPPGCQDMWRNRNLPSPISEDEKCASPRPTQTFSPKAPVNYERSTEQTRIPKSKLSNHVQAMEYDASNEYPHAQHDAKSTPSAHYRPNRLKMGIAMGFRSDCDKCQRRVPGHYSHIVRT